MAKILIVDDEKDLTYTLESIFKLKGHQAMPVFNGYKAIEEVKNTHYDLILMDIKLPGINGVETFLKIKEIDPLVKVIMMTGFTANDLIEKALKNGAYYCLYKPFDMNKVIEIINKAMKS